MLTQAGVINYAGFIEGTKFTKRADVVVCDGFVGNVALKTTEGTAIFVTKMIKRAFTRIIFTKIAAVYSNAVMKSL